MKLLKLIIILTTFAGGSHLTIAEAHQKANDQMQTSSANQPQKDPPSAESPIETLEAFKKIKNLEGSWISQDPEGETFEVTFEVVSGGHSVLEKIFGMINVYHLNGDQLMMTHYCTENVQPRMTAKIDSLEKLDRIDFLFQDVTNARSKDSIHIRDLSIEFVDADTIVEHWTYGDSSSRTPFSFELKRKP